MQCPYHCLFLKVLTFWGKRDDFGKSKQELILNALEVLDISTFFKYFLLNIRKHEADSFAKEPDRDE